MLDLTLDGCHLASDSCRKSLGRAHGSPSVSESRREALCPLRCNLRPGNEHIDSLYLRFGDQSRCPSLPVEYRELLWLLAFQRGVRVASKSQLGLPA